MKKYIKPTIKVREVAVESLMLDTSFSAKGNSWTQDVDTEDPPTTINSDSKILGKKILFEAWDEE